MGLSGWEETPGHAKVSLTHIHIQYMSSCRSWRKRKVWTSLLGLVAHNLDKQKEMRQDEK